MCVVVGRWCAVVDQLNNNLVELCYHGKLMFDLCCPLLKLHTQWFSKQISYLVLGINSMHLISQHLKFWYLTFMHLVLGLILDGLAIS